MIFFTINQNNTRGHRVKLEKKYTRTNTYKFYFSNRIVDIWNTLSNDVVGSLSLDSFKTHISRLNLSHICIGDFDN